MVAGRGPATRALYAADVIESALDALAQLPRTSEEDLRAGLDDLRRLPRSPRGLGLGRSQVDRLYTSRPAHDREPGAQGVLLDRDKHGIDSLPRRTTRSAAPRPAPTPAGPRPADGKALSERTARPTWSEWAVASYTVNSARSHRRRRLIDAHQYVLESVWSDVQPSAEDENAFLEGALMGGLRHLASGTHRRRRTRTPRLGTDSCTGISGASTGWA